MLGQSAFNVDGLGVGLAGSSIVILAVGGGGAQPQDADAVGAQRPGEGVGRGEQLQGFFHTVRRQEPLGAIAVRLDIARHDLESSAEQFTRARTLAVIFQFDAAKRLEQRAAVGRESESVLEGATAPGGRQGRGYERDVVVLERHRARKGVESSISGIESPLRLLEIQPGDSEQSILIGIAGGRASRGGFQQIDCIAEKTGADQTFSSIDV